MSWSEDTDNNVTYARGNVDKWKYQMTKIEQNFNKLSEVIDFTNRKIEVFKNNRSEFKGMEKEIDAMKSLIKQLTQEINELESLISDSTNQDINSQKNMIKNLRKRTSSQIKTVRSLCTEINVELQNREMQRKREISVTSHVLDLDRSSLRKNEQLTMDDRDLKIAMEEQEIMDKLTKDTIMLEDMFLKLNTMVVEQGDVVDHIHSTVYDADVKVELGQKELEKAVDYKRSAMKKKICIIGIVAAVVIILIIIITVSVIFTKRG